MAQYGYCEDCGCILEKVGCPNCNEMDVINYQDQLDELNKHLYPDWSQD